MHVKIIQLCNQKCVLRVQGVWILATFSPRAGASGCKAGSPRGMCGRVLNIESKSACMSREPQPSRLLHTHVCTVNTILYNKTSYKYTVTETKK